MTRIPGELTGQPSLKSNEDIKSWRSREKQLLDRIASLEGKSGCAIRTKSSTQCSAKRQMKLEDELQEAQREKEAYKNRLLQIEKELYSKQKDHEKSVGVKTYKSSDEMVRHLKAQNDDLRGALAKMTAILRDKTALCQNQDKKIGSLNNKIDSLSEVVAITKDLLNIRNMEVQHLSHDITKMEAKIDCERERHNMMLLKMDEAVKLNTELKKEYESQLSMFQMMRDRYEEKMRPGSYDGSETSAHRATSKHSALERKKTPPRVRISPARSAIYD